MAVTVPRVYRCGVCGKPGTADRMVYSSHTGHRYCIDIVACRKRQARKAASR